MFACNGILFNHESERRGETFVTRKIAIGAARIATGIQSTLLLGNMDAVRDWGYAPEYVEGMWLMLQQEKPADYVLATGKGFSVRDFVRFTFEHLGLEYEKYIRHDERYFRPTEVDALIGDFSKAQKMLGWSPRTLTPELARKMVTYEFSKLQT